jgi:hypothetical protein
MPREAEDQTLVEGQVSVAHHHIIPQARIMGLQVHLMEVGMGIGQGMVEVREPWPDQSLGEYAHFFCCCRALSLLL